MTSSATPGGAGRAGRPARAVHEMTAEEKAICEWEARHDVAARRRQTDPAAALHRYLTQLRIEEERHRPEHPDHVSTSPSGRSARHRAEFAAEHPLAATWLRWGEDPR